MCWRAVVAMSAPRLSSLARGVVMEVLFCLVFVLSTSAGVPVQTLNEIFQSVNNEEGLLRADLESIYAFTHKSWNPHILENEVSEDLDPVSSDPRVYMVLDDGDGEESNGTSSTTTGPSDSGKREVDPWSLIWYMASFGGLVIFFLVVSCSECCCSKKTASSNAAGSRPADPPPEVTQWVDEAPPPPYDLFAPPSYDTLFYGTLAEGKDKCEVYVVPIHTHMVAPRSAPT